jgi:hypothetical protein
MAAPTSEPIPLEPRFSASVQQPTRPACISSKAAMSVWVGHSCPTILILLITAVEDRRFSARLTTKWRSELQLARSFRLRSCQFLGDVRRVVKHRLRFGITIRVPSSPASAIKWAHRCSRSLRRTGVVNANATLLISDFFMLQPRKSTMGSACLLIRYRNGEPSPNYSRSLYRGISYLSYDQS